MNSQQGFLYQKLHAHTYLHQNNCISSNSPNGPWRCMPYPIMWGFNWVAEVVQVVKEFGIQRREQAGRGVRPHWKSSCWKSNRRVVKFQTSSHVASNMKHPNKVIIEFGFWPSPSLLLKQMILIQRALIALPTNECSECTITVIGWAESVGLETQVILRWAKTYLHIWGHFRLVPRLLLYSSLWS